MSKTTIHIARTPDGTVIGLYDGNGIFMSRVDAITYIREINMFYQSISDREIEQYIDVTTQRHKEKKWKSNSAYGKPGYIYLFETYDEFYKIGQSKNPMERLKAIVLQIMILIKPVWIRHLQAIAQQSCQILFLKVYITMPYRPKLIHKIKTEDMDWAEKYLHKKFAAKRVEGEWFVLSSEDVLWLMRLKELSPVEPGLESQ